MDICSSSKFHGTKALVFPSQFQRSLVYRKPNTVSCRAGKLDTENFTKNHYEVLSIPTETVSADEIKKAFRTKALQYHPDVCSSSRKEEYTRIFVELHKAYTVLSDPNTREEYDCGIGLRKFGKTRENITRPCVPVGKWEEQLHELKQRSDCRMARRDGSCGSRMRAQQL